MWFWCLMILITGVTLVGALFQRFFFWSMVGTGILWTVGIVIEAGIFWWQERALDSPAEENPSPEAPENTEQLVLGLGCAQPPATHGLT